MYTLCWLVWILILCCVFDAYQIYGCKACAKHTVGPQYVLWTEICRGKRTRVVSRAETTLQMLAFPGGYPDFIPFICLLIKCILCHSPTCLFSYVTVSEYDTLLTNSASGLMTNAFFSSHLLPLFIFV